MGFYNLNPTVMRELQPPDAGVRLARDGSNLASVLSAIASSRPQTKQRIEEYLSKIVPGLHGVDAKPIGPMETIEFKQEMVGSPSPWRFLAINMSDGTLRALGLLVALFQSENGQTPYVPLVGIEEPEIALHPAATGILFDSLKDASRYTQIIVTSHSPDLLDHEGLETEAILAVVAEKGTTLIAPIDAVGRSVLRERLYTAGELLRQNQLMPDPEVLNRVHYRQLSLFDDPKAP
ncbi:MAG: AAA family ATPase [Caldilineales bacterium]|nr:AAA family ATPase [Caldilineales bacterium]